ncbi:hypothetical protein COOONC_02769 [Cooperia oncophora]
MVREVQGEEEQQGSERVHEEVEQQENEQKARETKPVEELHGRGQQLQRTRRRQASSGDRRLAHYPGSTKHQRRVRSPEKFDDLRRVRRSASFEDKISALSIGGPSKPPENTGKWRFATGLASTFRVRAPDVIDGDLRYEIVSRKGLCKHCLGSCLPRQCKFNPRSCWYCEKIRGTCVEDLIPEGHHRALCPVPDVRDGCERSSKSSSGRAGAADMKGMIIALPECRHGSRLDLFLLLYYVHGRFGLRFSYVEALC